MIRLVCSNCQTSFEIDDGFVGGVCRCLACGTIQTVPTKEQLARGDADRASSVIFRRPDQSTQTSRTLEQLSDAVSGSGLAASGLSSRGSGRSARPATPPSSGLRRSISIAAVVCAILAAGGLVWAISRPQSRSVSASPSPTEGRQSAAVMPRLGEIDLSTSTTVIFLVDRGDATRALLPDIKRLVLRDLNTLGSTRRFQVIFWAQGDDVLAVPDQPLPATPTAIAQVSGQLDDITTGRSTHLGPALARAMTSSPSDLVIITAKGWQLDEAFADDVMSARKSSVVRIHVISIGDDSGSLRRIAESTGGAYRVYSADRFRQLGR